MILSPFQTLVIVGTVVLGTMTTRFLPFIIFSGKKETHPYIDYLGKVLPYAAISMLVVYCLRNIDCTSFRSILPQFIGIVSVVMLHLWKNNVLLSIGIGTAIYMFLIQMIFV